MDQDLFFYEMNNKVCQLQENIGRWKYLNKSQEKVITRAVKDGEAYVAQLSKFVKEIKVYICIMGTISAGKSTFINSLIGAELLPSKNQECTKQYLFISYSDQLKIDGENYEDLEKANAKLKDLEKNKKTNITQIEYPSVFHQNFPPDLRNRIIFIDTPGFNLDKQQQLDPFQDLKEIIGVNHLIQIWLSNYSTFDQDEKKYYQLQNRFIKQHEEIEKLRKQNLQIKINLEEQKQIEKNFFVLNKYDMRNAKDDNNIEEIIKNINISIGDNSFIYKVSAFYSLRYTIMSQGSEAAQNYFINKTYEAKQDDFENFDDCKEDCLLILKKKKKYIGNQEIELLKDHIIKQLKTKIRREYQDLLNRGEQHDYLLNTMLTFNLNLSLKPSQTLNILVSQFVDSINKELSAYEQEILNLKSYSQQAINLIIDSEKLKVSSIFQRLQTQTFDCKPFLKNICQKIQETQALLIYKIRELTLLFTTKIQIELFFIKIIESNREVEGISTVCLKLFNHFNGDKINEIEKLSLKIFEKSVSQILGIEIQTVSRGFINGSLAVGGITGVTGSAAGLVGSVAIEGIALSMATAGAGLVIVGLITAIYQWGKLNNQSAEILKNLDKLKLSVTQQIEDTCNSYAESINQTMFCIKKILLSLNQ